jgi:hypothetical protein
MKLEEIQDLWSEDCNWKEDLLDEELLRIPQLHTKYYKIFSKERLLLVKLKSDLKVLTGEKWEYYLGDMPQEDLQERGWEPFLKRPLKADIPRYIDSDRDIINSNIKIAYQQEKVDFLDSIIKSLTARGYNIKGAIEWRKFTNMNGAF